MPEYEYGLLRHGRLIRNNLAKNVNSILISILFILVILTAHYNIKLILNNNKSSEHYNVKLVLDNNKTSTNYNEKPELNTNKSESNNIDHKNDTNDKISQIFIFEPLFANNTKGPITVNRKLDNGNKTNLYNYIRNLNYNEFETIFYDKSDFNALDKKLEREEEYLCEVDGSITEDNIQGYDLVCPLFYHITIEEAFYGRHKHDDKHCIKDYKNNIVNEKLLVQYKNLKEDCGEYFNEKVQNECNNKSHCILQPDKNMFPDTCKSFLKYLHVKYHCTKDLQMKIPKIAIVMFANEIEPNSLYENAISEFYQYANIHNYVFIFNNKRYDIGRDMFYMKLHVLYEAVVRGLKNKEYEWIFWVDGDVLLCNPNIKLEVFLPTDNHINFIATSDENGLNAGVFFLRVNAWSLHFLMRSLSYEYFHPERALGYADQSSMNNVLVGDGEDKHYVIVPQEWFNNYVYQRAPGDFLIHFAGRPNKEKESSELRAEVYASRTWSFSKTSKKMRDEVLEYYALPKKEQRVIWFEKPKQNE